MPKNQLETAQLQREIVGVAVHDLGSVAAALVMRAALPPAVAVAHAENQQATLVSLAEQVRAVMQLLEVAQWVPDHETDATAPTLAPPVVFPVWLAPWPALSRRVLPRGSVLAVDVASDVAAKVPLLSATTAAVGMHVLLSALHEVRSAGSVSLRMTLSSGGQLECLLDTRSRIRRVGRGKQSRWQRYGQRLAEAMNWSVRWWEDISDEHGSQARFTLSFAP